MKKLLFLLLFLLPILGLGFIFPAHASIHGAWTVSQPPDIVTNGGNLGGMAVINTNDIWVVGVYNDGTHNKTLTEHWDGQQWTVISSPNPPTGDAWFNAGGVDGVSSNDVWAVGGSSGPALIEHWDGNSWSIISSPTPGLNSAFNAVKAIASNDVWAVGSYNTSPDAFNRTYSQALVEHWDGNSWSIVNLPSPIPGSQFQSGLVGISATSASDVWAVGNYAQEVNGDLVGDRKNLVLHWDGNSWQKVDAPSNGTGLNVNSLQDVVAISVNNAWSVGAMNVNQGPPNCIVCSYAARPVIQHWDGNSWSAIASPDLPYTEWYLNGITAVSPTDIWAVGFVNGTGTDQKQRTLIEQWDGNSWTVVSSPNPYDVFNTLVRVRATPSGDLWTIGNGTGSTNSGSLILHSTFINDNPPTINPIANISLNEGVTYSASSSFTDPDSTSWTATVDYGDGTGSQPLTLSGMNFSLSHQYTVPGTFTLTVQVTDNQGATGTATATITVYPVPTNKDQCKNGGWQNFPNLSFKNQGQCVSYVNHH